MVRFQIALTTDEASALARWAAKERRELRDQAALIIQRELERCGLLTAGTEGVGHD